MMPFRLPAVSIRRQDPEPASPALIEVSLSRVDLKKCSIDGSFSSDKIDVLAVNVCFSCFICMARIVKTRLGLYQCNINNRNWMVLDECNVEEYSSSENIDMLTISACSSSFFRVVRDSWIQRESGQCIVNRSPKPDEIDMLTVVVHSSRLFHTAKHNRFRKKHVDRLAVDCWVYIVLMC